MSKGSDGTQLRAPGEACWVEAVTIGRAQIAMNYTPMPDVRHDAVAQAARRLVDRGFHLQRLGTGVDRGSAVFQEATRAISAGFAKLGVFSVMKLLCEQMRRLGVPFEYGQFLLGRTYRIAPPMEPSIPFGFLVALAAKAPDLKAPASDKEVDSIWAECMAIARDLTSVIDVEPYNQCWTLNVTPAHLEELLQDAGLYDHLFGLRQWPTSLTPSVLMEVFGYSNDALLRKRFGWGVEDAVQFTAGLVPFLDGKCSERFGREALEFMDLEPPVLDALLASFSSAAVNAEYDSPLDATKSDLMFHPLIKTADNTFIAPVRSIVGPACYETVACALRKVLSSNKQSDVIGDGTERLVEALFRCYGMQPTLCGETYNKGAAKDAGECDLVLEDDHNILFVECKGKALTRKTMAAHPMSAVLDYLKGVLKAQAQGLQHERLLTANGKIVFDSGRVLELKGRRVVRLSVTLLDLGSLQDKILFQMLAEPFSLSKIEVDPTHPDRKDFDKANKELEAFRSEIQAVGKRKGRVWKGTFGTGSLNVGQLAVILEEAGSLARFATWLDFRGSYMSLNPLFDFFHGRKMGLLKD